MSRTGCHRLGKWRLSLFEKVLLVNSIMLIGEALAGLWVTSHNVEAHHYLIDTSFIVAATLLTLITNILLLRASFRPLFHLLSTIRQVSAGNTQARAAVTSSASEVEELAQAFNSMLDRLEVAHQEQTRMILQAQEDERRRISLELHDEAGQNLTALLVHTEVLDQSIQALAPSTLPNETQQHLTKSMQQLSKLTQHTVDNLRVLAQQLRPSVLDDLGLLAAFRWLVEDNQQRLHLDIDLQIDGSENLFHMLPPNYQTTLFRIAQESLTNIARHAHAQHVTIMLKQTSQHISLQIHDNGQGYDITHHHTGFGIVGMRERATLLKGSLTIQSYPGQGTIVQATLPLLPSALESKQVKDDIYGR